MIEDAWKEGLDPQGASHFNQRLLGTRAWIGATEIFSLLTFLGIGWAAGFPFQRARVCACVHSSHHSLFPPSSLHSNQILAKILDSNNLTEPERPPVRRILTILCRVSSAAASLTSTGRQGLLTPTLCCSTGSGSISVSPAGAPGSLPDSPAPPCHHFICSTTVLLNLLLQLLYNRGQKWVKWQQETKYLGISVVLQVTAAPSWVWSRGEMGNCVSWFWIQPPLCQTPRGYWAEALRPQPSAASGNSLAAWSTNSIRWWSLRTFCQPRRSRWDGSASLTDEPRPNLHGDLTLLIPVVISQMKINNSKILCAEKIPWKGKFIVIFLLSGTIYCNKIVFVFYNNPEVLIWVGVIQ